MSELKIMLPTDLADYKLIDNRSKIVTSGVDNLRDPFVVEEDVHNEMSEGDDQEDEDGFTSPVICIKKRHRRGKAKKRKWKPYYKLSWQERRELDDRETERANHSREAMFAHGQPVAPYNTTQFLMEDHNVTEPDFAHHIPNIHKNHHNNNSNQLNNKNGGSNINNNNIGKNINASSTVSGEAIDSSEEFYSSPEDEEDFLQRQFSEAYENVHAERLNAMSKTDLVQEYMQLEERVESLETDLKNCQAKLSSAGRRRKIDGDGKRDDDVMQTCLTLEETVNRLHEENEQLRCENELLRTMPINGAP